MAHGARQVVILGGEEPDHAGIPVLTLEIGRHRLGGAVARALDAEHHEGAALELAPEFLFDLAVVGHAELLSFERRTGAPVGRSSIQPKGLAAQGTTGSSTALAVPPPR